MSFAADITVILNIIDTKEGVVTASGENLIASINTTIRSSIEVLLSADKTSIPESMLKDVALSLS
jgi:muramoyltetrapeptide carboxypeptidase LdcA involved in peptidoglycan recycling